LLQSEVNWQVGKSATELMYGSLVMEWYAVICCRGTLHFLPYHPLPSKRLKWSWEIWGSTVRFPRVPAANAFTIRYDTVYLTCSKKLTEASLVYHTELTKNVKEKTKNKLISVISPVRPIP